MIFKKKKEKPKPKLKTSLPKIIVVTLIIITIVLTSKGTFDVLSLHNPDTIYFRNGEPAKQNKVNLMSAFKLAVAYKWAPMHLFPKFSEHQRKKLTNYAEVKWKTPIPPEKRKDEVYNFAATNNIDIYPWSWSKQPNEYKTINEFFGRKYKPSHQDHPSNLIKNSKNNNIHSVTTGKIVVFENILESTKLWIKNKEFTLEKTGLPNWKDYLNNPIAIIRLLPSDYHRLHSPISGKITDIYISPNHEKTWSHAVKNEALQNPNLNIFNNNRRKIIVIENEYGKTAIMCVGAVVVDSIVFNPEIKVGAQIEKGADLGSFYFGGSTVVMFTDSNQLSFDKDIIQSSKYQTELQVKAGEILGSFKK